MFYSKRSNLAAEFAAISLVLALGGGAGGYTAMHSAAQAKTEECRSLPVLLGQQRAYPPYRPGEKERAAVYIKECWNAQSDLARQKEAAAVAGAFPGIIGFALFGIANAIRLARNEP